MSSRWTTRLSPDRILLLLGVVVAVFFVPMGVTAAAAVYGGTACVQIIATEAAIVIDMVTAAGVAFAVTVSDMTALSLPVDFAVSEGLSVQLALVIVGKLGELPVTMVPGGFRVVIPEGVDPTTTRTPCSTPPRPSDAAT